MSESNCNTGEPLDPGAVRDALRAELTLRGFAVASDTVGMRREIYVMGARDLAKALFHFGTDAEEAAYSIYRSSGSWIEGMPARFAVLPASEADSPSIEMLEQMRATPLFYQAAAGVVTFRDLDEVVTARLD